MGEVTSLPVPAPEAPPVIERTVKFDRTMFNRWLSMELKTRLAGRVLAVEPGAVLRTSDGMVYAADQDGSLHVARDEQGRKLRPPRRRVRIAETRP